MSELLKAGQNVDVGRTGIQCTVEAFLGGGGQGEVYRAKMKGANRCALKWYFPHMATSAHRAALQDLIGRGPPTPRFLWPLELATARGVAGFGYVMPLREPRFNSIVDLMTRRAEPSFRALATAGLELAQSYLQLHSKGLCYRDISFGNVFFDPQTGEALICDNDNVTIDGTPVRGVLGTPDFMAPEIVRGEVGPSTRTDLYSLAVLLYYMFHLHHPLFGKRVLKVHALDLPARTKLCGTEPLFIFDPVDRSNAAVPRSVDPYGEAGDNSLAYWPIYPQFLRDLFTRAFTAGLRDPEHGRVRESEWRAAMSRLRDSITYCQGCRAENFYDAEALRAAGSLLACWSCKARVALPPRLRLGRNIVILNPDARLYPHHLDEQRAYDFSTPLAMVTRDPSNPAVWALKHLAGAPWSCKSADGAVRAIEPGRSVSLASGMTIDFGRVAGEVRV